MSITIRSAQTIRNGVTFQGNIPNLLPILFELDASTYTSPLSTWADISGNGRNATLHGTVPYYTDSVGGYFGFSGNGANYIDIAGSEAGWGIEDVPPNATFSVWANITPDNYYQAVAGWRSGAFNFYFLILNGNPTGVGTEARFDAGSLAFDIGIEYTPYFNTWSYITFVADSALSQTRLYINAVLVGTLDGIAGTWSGGNSPFTIGMGYGGDFALHGYIGGAMAYSQALNTEDVRNEFNRTRIRYGV
jgi:hypothetical protein